MADAFKASFLVALDRFGMFETWKGRQLLQRGRLAEAAVALEGRFSLENADRVIGREAPNVVALGKLKIHGGDDSGAREVTEIAKLMLGAGAPAVQRHGAWYLALHAMSRGEADDFVGYLAHPLPRWRTRRHYSVASGSLSAGRMLPRAVRPSGIGPDGRPGSGRAVHASARLQDAP
jgi:hypothetical protein